MAKRVINLNAGPAALPRTVLEQAARETLALPGSGLSILSISHRSKEFDTILERLNDDLAHLMGASPDEWATLWIQGGASTQFHAVAANLAARAHGLLPNAADGWAADYLVTGAWSQKALEAARDAGLNAHAIWDGKPDKYTRVALPDEWERSPNRLYTYVCTNETVHGVELSDELLRAVADHTDIKNEDRPRPLVVADMSSNILSRPVDMSLFDIVFAGAQKNMGPAGVTLVLVRKSVLAVAAAKDPPHRVPLMLDYATYAQSNSLYNTPPVHAMYVTGLVLAWLRAAGGIPWVTDRNTRKAALVYAALDECSHFAPVVTHKEVRSAMNLVFRVLDDEGKPSDALDNKFVKFCEARAGIVGLKGHRSVGGCRASLYNAVEVDEAEELVACIREFEKLL